MYEENPLIKFTINDESNVEYYNFIKNALDKKAQERLDDLFSNGFFRSSKHRPTRCTGIILPVELKLMLEITSPPKKDGITRCVHVKVCKFDFDQLKRGRCGKFVHLGK